MANKREIVVGAFVLVGMAVTAGVIFTIGNERRAFASKVTYSASFPDVQGLKPGAPVRLSGIDIGVVKAVGHGTNPQDDNLYVKMEIVQDEAGRIREGSIAKVANKGLLGDKMMEISPGVPGKPQIPPGAVIPSEAPTDYTNLLTKYEGKADSITTKTDNILGNLEKTSQLLADDAVRKDVQQTLRSVTIILNSVATSQGYVGKLLNDPAEAERISHSLAQLDRTSQKLTQTLDNVNLVVDRVNKGPGFLHSVIYDQDGNKSVQQIGDAAGEVAIALKQVREGNGLARSMLYGGPGQERINDNLTAMTSDMRAIVADMRKGKGTIGALLVDPSIYEDMKSVLGNVQRNDVLRALVRYSIKQDEKKPAVQIDSAASAPAKLAPVRAREPAG